MAEPPRLLEQVRDRIRARHLSYRTEKTYLYWIRRFIRFHKMRHPRDMAAPEIEEFLTSLAVVNKVSAATQNQALAGVLFLYRDVLEFDLPWLANVVRAKLPQHLPVVLTRQEVQKVIAHLRGTEWLIASLLYGSGMRVTECLQLRVKDLELTRREILIRDAKGQKDRVTVLPDALVPHLRDHLARVRVLYDADREANLPGVSLPYALRRKYPNAASSWAWQWVFPSRTILPRSIFGRAGALSSASAEHPALDAERDPRRRHREAGELPHLPPLLRHPSARGRLRHPHGAGTAGPRRREDDDDLHARAEPRRARREESAGSQLTGYPLG